MNEFAPMSQDNTPHPHERFFGAEHTNQEKEGGNMNNHEEYQNPMPNEGNPGEMPPATSTTEMSAPAPEMVAQPAAMGVPAMPEAASGTGDEYYNETRNRLMSVRKERNGIIVRIDKLEDQRIEKGEADESADIFNEISKLRNELWRKNNLIDALVKVLASLK